MPLPAISIAVLLAFVALIGFRAKARRRALQHRPANVGSHQNETQNSSSPPTPTTPNQSELRPTSDSLGDPISPSIESTVAVGDSAVAIVNRNQNTTYSLGSVVNNNWSYTYVAPAAMPSDRAGAQEKMMKQLKAAIGDRFVPDALYGTQPMDAGCMPGTRQAVLSKFTSWSKDDPVKILWLAGMAGTGKTSIAVTVCRLLQEDPSVVLGGTFFCSRSAGSIARTEVRRILPTLAACLAAQSPEFASALLRELKADDLAVHKPAGGQIGPLLVKPLVALAPTIGPIIFVIDALDECSNERELAELLGAIADLACDVTVKFVLTSRPEMHIRGTPIANPELSTILQLHEMSQDDVTADIRRYIACTLQIAAPNASWFTNDDIDVLTWLSHGLFIFASTALKYMLDPDNDEDRAERLGKVTSATMKRTAATTVMDKMYELVLSDASRDDKVDEDELEKTKRILACILTTRASLSVQALSDLIGVKPIRLRGSLRRLHSLVYLPSSDMEPGLRTLHTTFGDYLFHRSAAQLRIAASLGHDTLARGCLRRMGWDDLCFNVSRSQSSYELNYQDGLEWILLSLVYACLHWAHHVDAASDRSVFDTDIERIFCPKFLFWLEVLSVVKKVGLASGLLRIAGSAVVRDRNMQFLRDANFFVTSSPDAIEHSAPHIYLSALPFAAKDSLVYQTFSPLCTGLVSVEASGVDCLGGRLVMTLVGHDKGVESAAYSPEGRFIASGSEDGTLRIWDTRTGQEMGSPFRTGHGVVLSVAFSPECKSLASGTEAGVVCIWNLLGPMIPEPLYGHSKQVNQVTFSPDGSLLASASDDETARVWTAATRQPLAVLRGHKDRVTATAFSPDGRILATGSMDDTIRLWHSATGQSAGQHDLHCAIYCLCFSPNGKIIVSGSILNVIILSESHTGRVVGMLRDHTGSIRSVQFSGDGQSLVSASDDQTVILCNLRQSFALAFDGHTRSVRSAQFSPDGKYIASASHDRSIKIWEVERDRASQPLTAHDDEVVSLAVSLDDAFIISGSRDRTVRVWDIQTGKPTLPPLLGHTHFVTSVAIASNKRLIASASWDDTVRLWDATSGDAVGEPLRGHEGTVNTVAFSHDEQWLASGSVDKSVRIWDVATGQPWGVEPLICAGSVCTVAVSLDCLTLAAGDSAGYIYLWHTETCHPALEPISVNEGVEAVAFSPDGANMLSVAGGIVTIWLFTTGEQLLDLGTCAGKVRSAAYSPDGQLIACGSAGLVTLWNATHGTLLARLHGHREVIQTVAFTNDGKSMISGSDDSTIRVWNVKEALSPPQNDAGNALSLASTELDGRCLRSDSGDRLLWIPTQYRNYLQMPPCTMVIGKRRIVVSADGLHLNQGGNWVACWRGSSAT